MRHAAAVATNAFGPLCRALRRAEALGHNVEILLARVAAQRGLLIADDVYAMLGARLTRATGKRRAGHTHFIAGDVPAALGPMTEDERAALQERARLIAAASERTERDAHPIAHARSRIQIHSVPGPPRRRDTTLSGP